MSWRDYAFAGLLLFNVGGLGYSWFWWFKAGRRQPNESIGRAVAALVFNTLLPWLVIGYMPHCSVPPGFVLVGVPFAALGCVLGQGQLRPRLATCVLASYLMFALSIPISPGTFNPRTGTEYRGC